MLNRTKSDRLPVKLTYNPYCFFPENVKVKEDAARKAEQLLTSHLYLTNTL